MARPAKNRWQAKELTLAFEGEESDGRLRWANLLYDNKLNVPDPADYPSHYISSARLLLELSSLGVLNSGAGGNSQLQVTAPFMTLKKKSLDSLTEEHLVRLPTPLSYTHDLTWKHPHAIAPYIRGEIRYSSWSLTDIDGWKSADVPEQPTHIYLHVCRGVSICVRGRWHTDSDHKLIWECANGPILELDPTKSLEE